MKPFLFCAAAALLLGGEAPRFDHKVRELYFAAFSGNTQAMTKAMEITAAALKENPDHAEALVWHGGGVFFQSGEKFRSGDLAAATEWMKKGTAMMDRAVELQPKSVAVRIPRGAAYLASSRTMPAMMGRPLLEKGLSDFEAAWEIQKNDLSRFSQHSLGELWIGIADGNARLGNRERAVEFFKRIQQELPDTPWAAKAARWFEAGALSGRDGNCVGCHIGSPKAFHN